MNIKLKIITTLLGVFFGCGIVTSQTPKAELIHSLMQAYRVPLNDHLYHSLES